MDIQLIIVLVITASAVIYAAVLLRQKVRSFSTKKKCVTDCGCGKKA